MDTERSYAERIKDDYGKDISRLAEYIPYFTNLKLSDAEQEYDGKFGRSSLSFNVYDPELLRFMGEAAESCLMDSNYLYAYRRAGITTPEQEMNAVKNAEIKDIDTLKGILSRYVLEGRYRSGRWGEAVERGVFLNVLIRLKELLDFSTVR